MDRLKTAAILVLLVSVGSPSLSADQVVKEFPGGSAEEMLKSTKTPDFVKRESTPVPVKLACTTSDGKVLTQGESGFEGCLAEKGKQPHRPRD